jgi:MFS family permease
MRIIGGYFLGILADKIGFFKTMKLIGSGMVIASFLLAFFDPLHIFESEILLCLVHGLMSFFRCSCFVLPVIYIFQHNQKIKRFNHSAIAWTAVIFAMLFANLCATIFSNTDQLTWCIIYGLFGLITSATYSYVEILPRPKHKQSEENPVSKQAFLLAFLLSGLCAICISYQYSFIERYLENVMIINPAGQQLIYSPFWITLALTLVPAAHITKKLQITKILQKSLIGVLFSIGLLYIIPSFDRTILVMHQIIYAISFGLFLPAALRFIYRLLQGYNSYFPMNYTFSLGFSSFILISSYLAKLNIFPAPLIGASLITVLMLACLLINHTYGMSQKKH